MKRNNLWKWGMFIMYISLPFYFMKKCMTNTSNTSFVKGYYCLMYSFEIFKQLLREKENNEIPEPLIGDRVISTDELLHSDRTKY